MAICTGVLWGGPVGAGEAYDASFNYLIAAIKRGDYEAADDWFVPSWRTNVPIT